MLRDGLDAGRAHHEPIDQKIDLSEWLTYGTQRVAELHREVIAGTVGVASTDGRGATLRVNTADVGQRLAKRRNVQQPSLFDFTGPPGQAAGRQFGAIALAAP